MTNDNTPAWLDQAKDMLAQKQSSYKVAAAVGVSRKTIRYWTDPEFRERMLAERRNQPKRVRKGRPKGIKEKKLRLVRADISVKWDKLSPFMTSFFKEVLRQRLGWTALEHYSGVPQATLQGWSKGRKPDFYRLEQAVKAIGHELWMVRTRGVSFDRALPEFETLTDAQQIVFDALTDDWLLTADIVARVAERTGGGRRTYKAAWKLLMKLVEAGKVEKRSDANMAAWRRAQSIAQAA